MESDYEIIGLSHGQSVEIRGPARITYRHISGRGRRCEIIIEPLGIIGKIDKKPSATDTDGESSRDQRP